MSCKIRGLELATIGIAVASLCAALAACWICARSAPTELLTGFDSLSTQVRVIQADMEQLEGSWKRKVLELDGLTEELSGVFDKVERSRKSIAARQSKENAQAPPVPQTPEEMHHQLMLLARSQGHPV